jgi:DNA polymerase V
MHVTQEEIDLNLELCSNPTSTFFIRVEGVSMQHAHIQNQDILIVDKSLVPKHNNIIVAVVEGEFIVRRLKKKEDQLFLMPENPNFKSIKITAVMDFKIWGVVTHTIHTCT